MVDHSRTYKIKSVRNAPHISRLKNILSILDSKPKICGKSYCDVGCSNGYITDIIMKRYRLSEVVGFDHSKDNLKVARALYSAISFRNINLNRTIVSNKKFNLVTCFETLEHVGNVESALKNILNLKDKNGCVLVTVPIEIGFLGLMKFIAKMLIYRYSLNELSSKRFFVLNYLGFLLSGKRLSLLRINKSGWGSHFGFDYRDVDDYLLSNNIEYESFNNFTTRFYVIK
ncbi:methyltransferase domain-containing protein [Candidatus Woesearchaeota archaeon]|jgi:trans-aconitate methyltransferase|nr:methyltransferase domain-containing protein [Candidatus Woesearchaeota archaeon]MBT3537586.1 methyltransferase domain-containing protein [Candidatus Woesearchaeota archaeon]MBT4696912.1 methyltransferase domain-containing protein [Candidatus Woesearchaeota archaeon]MBT4716432.1 methyltransferase domain-containing protein [Candidatus Woesearchaeota archaeon]MBT7105255.1 methyltransferase domain-containing protein [Candidatus Woesearchaeota archaeon]